MTSLSDTESLSSHRNDDILNISESSDISEMMDTK
jgi:hypothetical protein